ncbi:ribosomal protein L11 methyltransferase [Luminiphilus syltensis NOR5-1B]|uniref:Ribosomal protein L11 methyltransferase n=1 Tax=Luminiphilus syltensis NOR5-1B TaxID=565045 RepID=B8KW07_9GAMM|nr:50S ribosomal protein L11 methyltransferase [Luminiphilus syltensis]EED36695.1 ribosomal protein L11 methyltransferase [Luminiphilus syltensis NOR5-1B]
MTDTTWQELRFDTVGPSVDALEDYLFSCGAAAVTLRDNADQPLLEPGPGETPIWDNVCVIALFPSGTPVADVLAGVPRELVNRIDTTVTEVEDQDWERAWMDSFHPMKMGDRLWICPSWTAPPEPEAVNILLDPGLAFGTGTHPTTAMCLGALDKIIQPGMRVVDYGCGTGILAIAALKLGATRALGVDNDPQALTASHQNAERNHVDPDRFAIVAPNDAAIDQWRGQSDLVVANILAGPLAELAPLLCDLLKPGGRLLLAGLLDHQMTALIDHYQPWLTLASENDLEEWVLLGGMTRP